MFCGAYRGERVDGWTGGRADERTGGQVDKWTGGQADRRRGGRVDGWTGGQMIVGVVVLSVRFCGGLARGAGVVVMPVTSSVPGFSRVSGEGNNHGDTGNQQGNGSCNDRCI